ncbi:M28 family peptidase [Daejeonella sp.]|uniref:M28 family peptidase n=1 Tax=Daejeonella sp. TaxID=2805397 RepID=UPI002728A8E1|nr:M28 family peptidase [Daejeonella sp.]MDO8994237.1 M28 family peptidase [Daejeonella sp.]MDP2415183.1 M28 family peptidase [Daejeonella sp.]
MMINNKKLQRAEFIKMTGGLAFLMLSNKWSFAESSLSSDLVASAQKRQEYTISLLKQLVTDIGPRLSGSKAYAKAAKIVLKEMQRSLPQVNYDKYEFDDWGPVSSSDLIVAGQHIEAIPQKRGFGTPAEGVRGIFKKDGTGYAIIDEQSDQILAYFSVSQYGRAIAGSASGNLDKLVPVFGLGKQDILLLDRFAKNKSQAWIKSEYKPVHKAPGINVIGRIQGKSKSEILIIAHLDTIFNTAGANDNAASVIVMLMLAHAASARQNNHTLTFLASDSEEYVFEGAYHYANSRIADNTMKDIKYVLNFDSLTYGPNLWINSKDQGVKDMIRDIHKDLNIESTPIYGENDGFVMDSLPFKPSGARALHANSRGYDEKTLPVYHRPDDTADKVPLDCVEISFKVFDEFIKRVDRM